MLYAIKLRIYDYDFEKEKLEPIYVGEGVVNIEYGIVEGNISRDYVSGTINDGIDITVFDVDFKQGYNLVNEEEKEIELPGKYTLYCGAFMVADIIFDHKIEEEKYKDAMEELKKIKHLAKMK